MPFQKPAVGAVWLEVKRIGAAEVPWAIRAPGLPEAAPTFR